MMAGSATTNNKFEIIKKALRNPEGFFYIYSSSYAFTLAGSFAFCLSKSTTTGVAIQIEE